MKILIVSDSHSVYNLDDLYHIHHPDLYVHAGDSQLLNSSPYLSNIDYIVRGNCDFNKKFNMYEIFNNILLTHGHDCGVKYELEPLADIAKENNCNIAIYGHTHVVDVANINGVVVINPGSVSQSRSKYPETYMLLDTKLNVIELYNARNNIIIEKIKLPF